MSYAVHARPILLVVDDDEKLRELVKFTALRSGEFALVQTAADGSDALVQLFTGGDDTPAPPLPDLILTDLSMPNVNGLELIGRLKAEPRTKDIPIVMFSSSAGPDDRDRALAAGCLAFHEKPVGLAALKDMLHSISSLLKTV